MTPYARIIDAIRNGVWAIAPEKLMVILDLIEFRADGGRLSDSEIQARLAAAARPGRASSQGRSGAVAILPLVGTIIHRADAFTENNSGAISIERFRGNFRTAMNMPEISSIVLDVDSPGGVIDGVPEMAAEIRRASAQKPIVAHANTLMASAAYWLGSAAGEVIASPSGDVGSVGVWTAHEDWSKFFDQKGIKTTLISAGKFKVEGNPFGPLTDEARVHIQGRVNEAYGEFVDAVARHRGVPVSRVRESYGAGRSVSAKEALRLGMVDSIGTIDSTIARLASGYQPRVRSSAAALSRRPSRDLTFGGPAVAGKAGRFDFI